MNSQQQIQELLIKDRYTELINFCEQQIETEPDVIITYWYLGLAYLLKGEEEAAQTTWFFGLSEATPETEEELTNELVQIIEHEAQRQVDMDNFQKSWLLRQHLREISPEKVNNLLYLIQLSIKISSFTPELLQKWQIAELLSQNHDSTVDSELLLETIKQLLEFRAEEILRFIEASLPHLQEPSAFIDILITAAVTIAYKNHQPKFAAHLMEFCLQLNPEHPGAQKHLSSFYGRSMCYEQAIETAQRFYQQSQTLYWKLESNSELLKALISAGAWQKLEPIAERQKFLLSELIENLSETIEPKKISASLVVYPYFLHYIQDNPRETRWFHNELGRIFQRNLHAVTPDLIEAFPNHQKKVSRPLKIGYVGSTLRAHSVGWLSRWLFQYHDRESFEVNLYLVIQNPEDKFTQYWFVRNVNAAYSFGTDAKEIASKIRADEIDILVDLDSTTLDTTCTVMALKPAPVQVTWLGWDASGLPAIDYLIADPYVLPEKAQEYYSEKIWRLPLTYIAVDGFEVGIATQRREKLEIPLDAVIYSSSQKGAKRNPDTVRLQLRIIKNVPNSYFLIKGIADDTTIQNFFTELAAAEGVDPTRLRFLERDPNELVHRANMQIADVVLDTFPYNGATTTLETLWLGIPLVTRVGQQFSARTSYAFMTNVGITEGIAWTDEEYIEWGIRFGTDESLRQKVAWKLHKSRQSSPLWNAKQFTREMENAYRQMWQHYNG